ncbi:MAG: hypothetical protein V1920_06925 [Bacillota bacterium]
MDWDKLTFIDINRPVNTTTEVYKNLLAEIVDDQAMLGGTAVIDQYGNIIEGQHRANICHSAEIPFEFSIGKPADIERIQRINNNHQKWTYLTTLGSQIAAKNQNYETYKKFMDKHIELISHNIRKMFLSQKKSSNGWKKGYFKAGNEAQADKLAKFFIVIAKHLKGRQQEFARSWMLAVIKPANNKKYSQRRFKKGLDAYLSLIEPKTKKVFIPSKGYLKVDAPQTMNECNHLINDIYNCGFPKSNLLPEA